MQAGRKLDTVGYSSLLSALARSSEPSAAQRADEVFSSMLASGIQADTQVPLHYQYFFPPLSAASPSPVRALCFIAKRRTRS